MIHSQQTNKQIQMFRWHEKDLTKHWRRQTDFKAILIHQATCSTSKSWPIQRPVLNALIQKLKATIHSWTWRTDNGIEHSERASQIFIIYSEIKWKNEKTRQNHNTEYWKYEKNIWCKRNECESHRQAIETLYQHEPMNSKYQLI